MKIAVDFDGTLADVEALILDLLNFRHGTQFTMADLVSYDTIRLGIGPEADFWEVYDMLDRTHLRRAARPVSPFAAPTIKRLLQMGHEAEVLTANSPAAIRDMTSWLFGHGLDISIRALGRVRASEKAALDYDLFFDDSPHLAEAMSAHPEKTLVLIDQPWTQSVICRNDAVPPGDPRHVFLNVYRLRDWEKGLGLLRDIGVISA